MRAFQLLRPAHLLIAVALAACGDRTSRRDPAREALPLDSVQAALAAKKPVHVDSVFTAEEEARRFRLEVGDSTDTLRHAARSRERLVAAFRDAIERNDRAALGRLAVDAVEFGSLVYPTSRYAREPYFLKPQTAWFNLSATSGHDADVLIRRFGGHPFRVERVTCADTPVIEGRNRLWDDCRIRFAGDTTGFQLFGQVIERDGRFKFLSLANRL